MKPSRVAVGLALLIFMTVLLLGLAQLSYEIRYHTVTLTHARTDSEFPLLVSLLWIFGPLDWWSFITPLAIAVGAAGSIRNPMRLPTLAWILGLSVLQALVLAASVNPDFRLTIVMGYPEPAPYQRLLFIANLSLVGTSVGLALYSVSRSFAYSRARSLQEV